MREHGIAGEVIVADNGSSDGSPAIALRAGRGVVNVADRGYGNALMGGIDAAARPLRDHGRRRRQRRLPRDPANRRQAPRGIRSGPGLPTPGGRRSDPARGHAVPPPLAGQSRCSRCSRVAGSGRGRFTTSTAGCAASRKDLYRSAGPALHRDGVRDRDDHQGEPLRGARSPKCPSRSTLMAARSHPPHLKTFRDGWRTLRFFLHVLAPLAVSRPGRPAHAPGLGRLAVAMPGLTMARRDLRRPHPPDRELGDPVRLSDDSLRHLHEDLRRERRPHARGSALHPVLPAGEPGARARCSPRSPFLIGVALLLGALNQWRLTGLRPTRLRPHDAPRRPGRDADRAGHPDRHVELLRQHPRDGSGERIAETRHGAGRLLQRPPRAPPAQGGRRAARWRVEYERVIQLAKPSPREPDPRRRARPRISRSPTTISWSAGIRIPSA